MTDVRSLSNEELIRLYGGEQLGPNLGVSHKNIYEMSDDELRDFYNSSGKLVNPVTAGDLLKDMAVSAPGAAYRGVTALGATPGALDALMSGGVNAVAGAVGAEQHPRLFGPGGGVSNLIGGAVGGEGGQRLAAGGVLPTPGELEGRISERNPAFATLPEPQYGPGKISSAAITGGIGSLGLGAGGAARSFGTGAVAGGVGEAAGQGAESLGLDPLTSDAVRLGATLATGAAGNMRKPRDVSPSRQALADTADQHFTAARQSGVAVGQPAVANVVDEMIDLANREGYRNRPNLRASLNPTPMTDAILHDFNEASVNDLTLDEAWRLRKGLGNAISQAQGEDRRIVRQMRDHFDDWMEHRLSQADLAQGNLVNPATGQLRDPHQAFGDLREGQRLWSRVRKSDTLAEMEADARIDANPRTGRTYAEALRQKYKNLAKSDQMRTFTREEQDAIRRVANGGPADLVYQAMAGFYPFSTAGALRNVGLAGGAYGAGLGPAGALFPAAGLFGKAASSALVRKNAAMADMLVRGGAGTPMPRGSLMGGLPLSLYYGNIATTGPGGQ